jgi:phosphoglycolate phosphatase
MRLSGWAVFDLDGTLVNTLGEIHLALNRVLVRHGRSSLQREVVRDLVGNGPKTLMERAWSMTGSNAREGETTLLAMEYSMEYEKNPVGMSRPYPGVHEGLQRLIQSGWRLAVCTNKHGNAARALVRDLGWESWIRVVVSGEESFRKPDPRPLRFAFQKMGACFGRHLFIGDSEVDLKTAQNAGVEGIFLEHGYGVKGRFQARSFSNAVDLFSWMAQSGPCLR